jgi:hypothetical protein
MRKCVRVYVSVSVYAASCADVNLLLIHYTSLIGWLLGGWCSSETRLH